LSDFESGKLGRIWSGGGDGGGLICRTNSEVWNCKYRLCLKVSVFSIEMSREEFVSWNIVFCETSHLPVHDCDMKTEGSNTDLEMRIGLPGSFASAERNISQGSKNSMTLAMVGFEEILEHF